MSIVKPSWKDLSSIIESFQEELIIAAPYYSEEGISILYDSIVNSIDSFKDKNKRRTIIFMIRLNPYDWIHQVIAPENLLSLIELLEDNFDIQLFYHPRIHAKAYLVDNTKGILGSANLTEGGFKTNFELAVTLTEEQAVETKALLIQEIEKKATLININILRSWIDENKDEIKRLQSASSEDDAQTKDILQIQKSLFPLLTKETSTKISLPASIPNKKNFITWLSQHQTLPYAAMLKKHHDGYQNRSGHFLRSYQIVMLFYYENFEMVSIASIALDHKSKGKTIPIPEALLKCWIKHLDNHNEEFETTAGLAYSYPLLKNILPTSMGGIRTKGGGGVGTTKRMLLVLARYLHTMFPSESDFRKRFPQ